MKTSLHSTNSRIWVIILVVSVLIQILAPVHSALAGDTGLYGYTQGEQVIFCWSDVSGADHYVYNFRTNLGAAYNAPGKTTYGTSFSVPAEMLGVGNGEEVKGWVAAVDTDGNILTQDTVYVPYSKSEPEEEECNHKYNKKGYCKYCGEECPHNGGDIQVDSGITYVSVSDKEHKKTRTYDVQCSICRMTLEEDVVSPDGTEAHLFNENGDCSLCDYRAGCSHRATADSYDGPLYSTYSESAHIKSYRVDKVCANPSCGEVLEWGYRTERSEEAHTFSGNTCTLCGYTLAELSVSVSSDSGSAYVGEQIGATCHVKGGSGSYSYSWQAFRDGSLYSQSADARTRWTLNANEAGSWSFSVKVTDLGTNTELHASSGNIAVSPAVCSHENCSDVSQGVEYLRYSDSKHEVDTTMIRICNECGDTVAGPWVEKDYKEHDWNENRCSFCGALALTPSCKHPDIASTVIKHEYANTGNNNQHTVTLTYEDKCAVCEEVINTTRTSRETEVHHFDGAQFEAAHPHRLYRVCRECGYIEYTGENQGFYDQCQVCNPAPVPEEEVQVHIHHLGDVQFEAAHPHKLYRLCSECGYAEYTGGNQGFYDQCEVCNPAPVAVEEVQVHIHHLGDIQFEAAHPHKLYRLCSECGYAEYTGDNLEYYDQCQVCNPAPVTVEEVEVHFHQLGDVQFEAAHPHKLYRMCSECGYIEYTGENQEFYDQCLVCNPASVPDNETQPEHVHNYEKAIISKGNYVNQTTEVHSATVTYWMICTDCDTGAEEQTETITENHTYTSKGHIETKHNEGLGHATFDRCTCGAVQYTGYKKYDNCCDCYGHKWGTIYENGGRAFHQCVRCGKQEEMQESFHHNNESAEVMSTVSQNQETQPDNVMEPKEYLEFFTDEATESGTNLNKLYNNDILGTKGKSMFNYASEAILNQYAGDGGMLTALPEELYSMLTDILGYVGEAVTEDNLEEKTVSELEYLVKCMLARQTDFSPSTISELKNGYSVVDTSVSVISDLVNWYQIYPQIGKSTDEILKLYKLGNHSQHLVKGLDIALKSLDIANCTYGDICLVTTLAANYGQNLILLDEMINQCGKDSYIGAACVNVKNDIENTFKTQLDEVLEAGGSLIGMGAKELTKWGVSKLADYNTWCIKISSAGQTTGTMMSTSAIANTVKSAAGITKEILLGGEAGALFTYNTGRLLNAKDQIILLSMADAQVKNSVVQSYVNESGALLPLTELWLTAQEAGLDATKEYFSSYADSWYNQVVHSGSVVSAEQCLADTKSDESQIKSIAKTIGYVSGDLGTVYTKPEDKLSFAGDRMVVEPFVKSFIYLKPDDKVENRIIAIPKGTQMFLLGDVEINGIKWYKVSYSGAECYIKASSCNSH